MASIKCFLSILCLIFAVHGAEEFLFGQSASFTGTIWTGGNEYRKGILAAFQQANAGGGANGHLLRLLSYDDMYNASRTIENCGRLLSNPNISALVGFTGTEHVIAASTMSTAAKVPFIGGNTGIEAIRSPFNPYIVNLRSGYNDEVIAMVKYLVEVKRLKRVSIVYQNDSFGLPAFQTATAAMARMKLYFVAAHPFNAAQVYTQDFTKLAFEILVSDPQGVVTIAPSAYTLNMFYAVRMITMRDIAVATGSWHADAVRQYVVYNKVPASIYDNMYYQTQVVPSPWSTTSPIVSLYRSAMLAYDSASTLDYLSLEGFMLGKFLVDIAWRARNTTPAAILEAVYTTKMFELGELTAGPFSQTCYFDSNPTASTRTSLCNCNQGMRFIAVSRITTQYNWVIAAPDTMPPITQCFSPVDVVSRPVVLAAVTAADVNVSAAAGIASSALIASSTYATTIVTISVNTSLPSNTSVSQLLSLGNETILMGAVQLGAPLPVQSEYPYFKLFSQPVEIGAKFTRNVIHVLSTIEQEMFVNAKHIARVENGTIVFLLHRDSYGADAVSMVQRSLQSFGRSLDGEVAFGQHQSLEAALKTLPDVCSLIVVGISNGTEMQLLIDHLTLHKFALCYLPFSDVSLYWRALSLNDRCQTLPSRVFFSTGLPHWTADSTDFVTQYRKKLASSDTTHPMVMVGYLLARFCDFVNSRAEGNSDPDTFVDNTYRSSVVALDDLTLGPFVDTQCTDTDCLCNIGPRVVRTLRISSIADGTQAEASVRFSTCTVEYALPQAKGVNLALIIPLSTIVPLLIVGLGLAFCRRKNGRDNSCAPTNPKNPFAVVFTDIESSTMLWGRYPAVMAKAIDDHHDIIRAAIKRHNMYEVKTIGDSFMVVAQSADDGMRFAEDVQRQLFLHNWGTSLIDEFYVRVDETTMHHKRSNLKPNTDRVSEENDVNVPPCHHEGSVKLLIDPPNHKRASFDQNSTYESCWNGIRVRIGLNFGRGEIRFDEISQGYDFYGPVVNEAARIEAVGHGGQTVTVAEYLSAASGVDMSALQIKQLGVHTLRGVERPVTLVQVVPVELKGRVFPELRFDAVPKDTISMIETCSTLKYSVPSKIESSGSSTSAAFDEVLGQLAAKHSLVAAGLLPTECAKTDLTRIKSVIDGLFKASAVEFRKATLQTLFANWRVHTHTLRDGSQLDVATLRMAARVAETDCVLETMRTLPPEEDDQPQHVSSAVIPFKKSESSSTT